MKAEKKVRIVSEEQVKYSGPRKYSSTLFLIGIHKEKVIFKGDRKKI